MTTSKFLPRDMLQEIGAVLQRHRDQSLQVYAEAEKIRLRWEHLNIALEDILNSLVERSGDYNIAVAFDPAEAKTALLGSVTMDRTPSRDAEAEQSAGHSLH